MTKIELKYLFLIIVIYTAACVETDIYLPAFPDMMNYFAVSEGVIQKLLTWNFIGICLSCPFYGPISDSFGRKKPLMVALGFFVLGSIMTMFASNYNLMLVGRFLQGVGSGGCFTLGTAIIFDAFHKDRAMKAVSDINLAIPFLMAGAPLLGGVLNHYYGFRSNFTFIAILCIASFVICWYVLDEPLKKEDRTPFKLKKIGADFIRAFTNFAFWQMTIVISLIFGAYILALSVISVLYVVEFEMSKSIFPLFQAAMLIGWLIASIIFKRVLGKLGSMKVKGAGMMFITLGAIFLTIATIFTPRDPYFLTAPLVLFSFGANWIMSLYFPEGMEALPDIKGIVASLVTSFRLLATALIVGVASKMYNGTMNHVTWVVVSTVAISVPLLIVYEWRKKRANQLES
ncbi:MAG: multidrug effflux MFS transporter [Rhabdochlamydiaceae bacterium]|nr:multidrug effflux MFS transporter [Candidatus Amphrikana amoebophyrae]